MKKVYVPTMDELYQMQDITDGHSMYKYILIKAIESLIIDGTNHPNKGILKNAYKYLRENPDIAYAICSLYPEEIKYSEYAQNDWILCSDLISGKINQDKSIYLLDNLSYFETGDGILSNIGIMSKTVKTLAQKLPQTPNYRFEYKQNSLLDNIFSCNIPSEDITKDIANDIINIEPSYILTTNPNSVIPGSSDKKIALYHSINNYANRYGVKYRTGNNYYGKDILTNPDEEVKKLLKCIKEHNR